MKKQVLISLIFLFVVFAINGVYAVTFSPNQETYVFDTPGEYTFDIPSGQSPNLRIQVWGAGGGGGRGHFVVNGAAGSGGGGGGYVEVNTVARGSLTIKVGKGGKGAPASRADTYYSGELLIGDDGGYSLVYGNLNGISAGATLLATEGTGGIYSSTSGGGGEGFAFVGGITHISHTGGKGGGGDRGGGIDGGLPGAGGSGAGSEGNGNNGDSSSMTRSGKGGAGGSPDGGDGGDVGSTTAVSSGKNGEQPGGGGAGGSDTRYLGGNGGDGKIIITTLSAAQPSITVTSITVTSPTAGQTFVGNAGTSINVMWTTQNWDANTQVNIDLINTATNAITRVGSYQPNDGLFKLDIHADQTTTKTYRVRVSAAKEGALEPGEEDTSGIFTISAASQTLCADDQIIMRLFSDTNSHVSPASDTNALIKICYDTLFGKKYLGSNPWQCNGNNVVLRTSTTTNAHAESPKGHTASYSNLCYGDLVCNLKTSCTEKETLVATLSSDTNAHISKLNDYPKKLCCRSENNILSADWRDPLTDAIITTARVGDSVNLTVVTTLPPETMIRLDIYEDDSIGGIKKRDEIKTNIIAEVGEDNVARYLWTITQEDFDKGTNKPFYDISILEFFFSARYAGETLDSPELIVTKEGEAPTTPWMCADDKKSASRYLNDQLLNTRTLAIEAKDALIAGEACKGSDDQTGTIDASTGLSTSRDDCCPRGYRCALQGCIIGKADSCDDYKTESECKDDNDNAWSNTLFTTTTSACENVIKREKCEWDGTACGRKIEELDPITGNVLGSCIYSYDDSQQCTEGLYKDLKVTARADGTVCNKCEGGTYSVPCGRPAFELPFFGPLQFMVALGIIVVIYLLERNKKIIIRLRRYGHSFIMGKKGSSL